MTTAQIARAFLVPEATMAQRLVRAKRKIAAGRHPVLGAGAAIALAARLDDVLTVICLAYNAGLPRPVRGGGSLASDAMWLAELVARALPARGRGLGAARAAHVPPGAVRLRRAPRERDASGPNP